MNLFSLFLAVPLLSASPLPIPPVRFEGPAAGNFICNYKYKMGDSDWIYVNSGGSTRARARVRRTRDIRYLQKKAEEANLSFEVRKLFCENPWGGDGNRGD
ncbi:hypothetical protein ACL6C3_15845 [Capilliphycus salinus ALCB114379]|uniref:hypothetical protein n=1 Tax=Capilliphycus salinus TaxID=2768948 RepID=UPI0039A5E605